MVLNAEQFLHYICHAITHWPLPMLLMMFVLICSFVCQLCWHANNTVVCLAVVGSGGYRDSRVARYHIIAFCAALAFRICTIHKRFNYNVLKTDMIILMLKRGY